MVLFHKIGNRGKPDTSLLYNSSEKSNYTPHCPPFIARKPSLQLGAIFNGGFSPSIFQRDPCIELLIDTRLSTLQSGPGY